MPKPKPSNFDDIMAESLPRARAETIAEMGRMIESRPDDFRGFDADQADQVIAQLRNMLANARVRIGILESELNQLKGMATHAEAA